MPSVRKGKAHAKDCEHDFKQFKFSQIQVRAFREIFTERIEDATAQGRIRLDVFAYREIMDILLPEEFREPPLAAMPTDVPPSSEMRVEAYAQRFADGVHIFHPKDGTDTLERGIRAERHSRLGVNVDGWESERYQDDA